MSELRKQLETARQHYAAAKYPGDLAAELLGRRSHGWGWQLGAAIALAASVAIVLLVLASGGSAPRNEIAVKPTTIATPATTESEQYYSFGTVPNVSFVEMANESEIVPPAYDMSFSAPPISFFSAEESNENKTTPQESV